MSTMKKIFALTIAIVMVMSVAIFADFSDKAQISDKCLDDVNTLTAIGLIKGYEDGTFKPTGNITRAEACKMIYVLRNGGDDDGAESWKGAASFADVSAANWFSGYVAYCAQYNIVAGRSATTFDPNANVTSLELAKMLLVVAGYRADVQGYTGAEWASNVRKDAESAGLLKNYGAALTTAAPRQWACKMFKNTIDAKMAVYYGDMLAVGTKDVELVGDHYLGDKELTACITANENWAIVGKVAPEGTFTIAPVKVDNVDFTFEDFAVSDDLVGKEVTIAYHRDNNKNKNYIYGVSETGKTIVGDLKLDVNDATKTVKYTLTLGDKQLTSKNVEAKKVIEKFQHVDAHGSPYYPTVRLLQIDSAATQEATPDETTVSLDNIEKIKKYLAADVNEMSVIGYDIEGDDVIDYIIVAPTYYGRVQSTFSNSQKLTVDFGGKNANNTVTFDFSDEDCKSKIEGGLADKDYVKATINPETGAITVSKLTEVVIGTCSERDEDGNVVIAGTAYEMYDSPFAGTNALNTVDNAVAYDNIQAGTISYTLYTDGKYIIRAEETGDEQATISNKYAYVIGIAQADEDFDSTKQAKVKVLLANGTVATLLYDTKASSNVYIQNAAIYAAVGKADEKNYVDHVFQYTMSSDGEIRFRTEATKIANAGFLTKDGKTTTGSGADNLVIEGKAMAYDHDNRQIGGYDLLDSAFFFAKYFENSSDKDAGNYSYKIVTAADIKSGMDTYDITVLVVEDKDGKVPAVLMGAIDYSVIGSGKIKGSDDQKVVFITGAGATSALDENEENKTYIKVVELLDNGTVGAETKVMVDGSGKTNFDKKDQYTFCIIEEIDTDEYKFTPIVDSQGKANVTNWKVDKVDGRGVSSIGLGEGSIRKDDAKDAKVFVRKNASTVEASDFASIESSDAFNIIYYKEANTDEVDWIIYSTSNYYNVYQPGEDWE